MSNGAIFEKVASRELTPEQGATMMINEEKEARQLRKPDWAPLWVWMIVTALLALCVAVVGGRRD